MYEPSSLLLNIDQNMWFVLSGFAIAMIFQCWWLYDAALVARRDKMYSIPLFCTLYWFAHDLGFVIRFDSWFNVYDHWYLKLFWVGLLAANIFEWVFIWQFIKYGRKEILPDCRKQTFALLLLLALIFSEIMHEFFKHFFGDPLFQLDPTLTMIIYPVLGAALMIRRRSTLGQSPTMWWTFSAMALFFHATCYIWFGGVFQTWPYAFAGLVTSLGGVCMAIVVAWPDEKIFGSNAALVNVGANNGPAKRLEIEVD